MIHCPGCGQGLRFDIPSQMMLCDFCGGSFDPVNTAEYNKNAEEEQAGEAYVYTCPSCGGELMTTDKTDAIGFCPYCGGASMLYDRINDSWNPKYIIPFKITKDQCKEAYLKKAKRSLFTSKKYQDPNLIEGFRGIYMPYWSYRAEHYGDFSVEGEKKYFSEVHILKITGQMRLQLDGYGHDASSAFDDRISEDLEPFDIHDRKPFAPGYLSGFYADIGDVDPNSYTESISEAVAKDTVYKMAKEDKITHSKNGPKNPSLYENTASIPTDIVDAEQTLYPVWFMSYRDKDKITYAAVNGQTGKVSADLPVSPWKILLTVLIVGLIAAVGMFFLPSMKANWTLALSSVLLAVGYVVLRLTFKSAVNEKTGLSRTEEAVRFKKTEIIRLIAVIICAVAGIVVAIIEPAYNWISYLGCLIQAGVLFWVMLRHIKFQAEIARRRPPQFNKKGAAYDEA